MQVAQSITVQVVGPSLEGCRGENAPLGLIDLIGLSNAAGSMTVLVATESTITRAVELGFKDRVLVCENEKNRAKQCVVNALQHTLDHSRQFLDAFVQGKAVAVLEQVKGGSLREDGEDISPQVLSKVLAEVGASIVLPANKMLGASMAAREAPRTQTECLIDWISLLRSEGEKGGGVVFGELLKKAQDLWMSGDVSIQSVSFLLQNAIEFAEQASLESLYVKAVALEGQVAKAAELWAIIPKASGELLDGGHPYARFHDNPYGRIFDSTMVECFISNPPVEVKSTTHALGLELARHLMAFEEGDILLVAKELQTRARDDQRFWGELKPALGGFLKAEDQSDLFASLNALLESPPVDGVDVILIQYLLVKVGNSMQVRDENLNTPSDLMAPWMVTASSNYKKIIVPAVNRLKNSGPTLAYTIPTAGTTQAHQPPALANDWMVPSSRPAMSYRPDFTNISPETLTALESGLPYVGGVSGSAGVILHWASYVNDKQSLGLDMRHVLMGALMFLNYDGGHGVHEVLWTANQLDASLKLKFDLQSQGEVENFKGGYNQLERLYENSSYCAEVQKAITRGWEKTISYFRDNSFYADIENA
ncbi:hypothetical protein KVG88_03990 [Pseudomonas sp. SWRI74]|uniref:Uncharacterized protein n=1 Tax=Pseudomonas azerbaijanoccidentalis TaxID=2842347 RepID=A0ABS6QJT1_9PSED|nr:hypothetical protein [Pseudomonas azerbaijanoccidentalis]MBV4519211.1 hypothetical protein [Pseudomonas azerbaijanoccidentalis]